MFLELVDLLRCPALHEETWLVAAVDRYDGRSVAAGTLGCPTCRASYPVHEGAVHFISPSDRGRAAPLPDGEAIVRAQALLGLSEPGGVVAFVGPAGRLADPLCAVIDVQALLINPVGVPSGPTMSVVWSERAPLAPGSLRAALVGGAVSAAMLGSLVRALKPRGRLVAPAGSPVPDGLVELARDDAEWVAEAAGLAASAPVGLRRR